MKKFLLVSLTIVLSSGPLYAESNLKPAVARALNQLVPPLLEQLNENSPDWLKRTEFELHFEEDFKLQWGFHTIQPLYRTEETYRHTLFLEAKYLHDPNEDTTNLGLGYRYLSEDENWLLGLNSFIDYAWDHRHQRYSLGGEIIGPFLSIHSNYYDATSGRRYFSTGGGFFETEQALDGWDIKGQIQVPYFPWMQATFRGYGWQGNRVKDNFGVQYSFRMNIIGNFVLEFGRSDDDNSTNNFANIRFTTGKPDSVEFTMVEDFFTKNFFTNRNLKNQTLARVERNHNIIIEKTSTGSGGVVVGRGT